MFENRLDQATSAKIIAYVEQQTKGQTLHHLLLCSPGDLINGARISQNAQADFEALLATDRIRMVGVDGGVFPPRNGKRRRGKRWSEGNSPRQLRKSVPVEPTETLETWLRPYIPAGKVQVLSDFVKEMTGGNTVDDFLKCEPKDIHLIPGFGDSSIKTLQNVMVLARIQLVSSLTGARFPPTQAIQRASGSGRRSHGRTGSLE